jgi:hypothetical protein
MEIKKEEKDRREKKRKTTTFDKPQPLANFSKRGSMI